MDYGFTLLQVIIIVAVALVLQRRWWAWKERRRLRREGRMPKQSQALYTEAHTAAFKLKSNLEDRTNDAVKARAIPDINKDAVEQAERLGVTDPWTETTFLERMMRLKDVLGIKWIPIWSRDNEVVQRELDDLEKRGRISRKGLSRFYTFGLTFILVMGMGVNCFIHPIEDAIFGGAEYCATKVKFILFGWML